jgi:hypothetical protein
MNPTTDPRIDRLYNLVPTIYRLRDAANGYVLQAFLRVVAEQVNVVEDNIAQLYSDWFIETADEWAVPYIGDLIGYVPVQAAGPASDDTTAEGRALNSYLIPRREVANTIGYRQRKGRLTLLEQLANDVANWPAYAVEFFKLLGWSQNIDHLHMRRARTVDVREMAVLDLIGTPFDPLARTVDVRRIDSNRTLGRYNIPSVGVFAWRLQSYKVTHTQAYCEESAGPQCMTFSVLGNCSQLFTNPQPRPTSGCAPPTPLSFPGPITLLAFGEQPAAYYGEGKSFAIWADGWAGLDASQPVPIANIIPTDLTGWVYVPPPGYIAVDPALGRFAFPASQLPRKGVRVSYHYGFSASIGGGQYERPILDPVRVVDGANVAPVFYRVGNGQTYHRIADALRQYQSDNPLDAVIELTDNTVYVEPLNLSVGANQTLQLRAAQSARPVIRLLDWQTDLPDSMTIAMDEGSRCTLDGLLITGRAVQINGPRRDPAAKQLPAICGSELVIRHCTLVPGWGINCECQPARPAEPSLELYNVRATVRIEHTILGSIVVTEDEVHTDPIPIRICDSILDSTDPRKQALGAAGSAMAWATLRAERTTVFGIVDVNAIDLAANSIFNNCVNVGRRQLGCMRFCYVPAGCRTPRRYHCQPDLVIQAASAAGGTAAQQANAIANQKLRVQPQFTSTRYGNPGYAQLGPQCATEIVRGADDESEMGAFHDLFQPQRTANLIARLNDYTPAGMDVGLILVN